MQLSIFINCCLPSEWQIHCIIPIFKAGNKNSVSNYRPISLLCIVSKVFECIIYNKVINSIFDHISTSQFGFLKGHSTLQQLFLKRIYEQKTQTDVIYLDFSKAFNRVPHNLLLLKLWQIGITGDRWWWFKPYLYNWFQCVCLNSSYSTFLPVLTGVPQGSILGPLLFLVYINDLFLSIHHSNALSFADDTKLFKPIAIFLIYLTPSNFRMTSTLYLIDLMTTYLSTPTNLYIFPLTQSLPLPIT